MTTKYIKISIEFIEKCNLKSKSVRKVLGTTKVVFLLSTAPPNVGLQVKRMLHIIIKKTRVSLPDQRECT
jgi:hypothetical protein